MPSLAGSDAQPVGIALLALAVIGYGVSNSVVVAPQQRAGAVPVVARALTIASVLLAPIGFAGVGLSEFTTASILAVVVLGVAGTGAARALNATLAGRTAAARGSRTTYLVPVIAIALGISIRNETIQPVQLGGTLLVLVAAWLTTRRTSPMACTWARSV